MLVLPPLGRDALGRWLVVGLVGVGLVGWFGLREQPWQLAGLVAVALLGVAWLLTARWHLDPVAGTLAVTHLGVVRRRVRLADASWVHLVDLGAGVMSLVVMPERGSAVRLALLVVGRLGDDSRTSEELRILATVLEHHATMDDPLPEVLRLQADHLERGDLETSPLAGIVLRERSRRGPRPGTSEAIRGLLD